MAINGVGSWIREQEGGRYGVGTYPGLHNRDRGPGVAALLPFSRRGCLWSVWNGRVPRALFAVRTIDAAKPSNFGQRAAVGRGADRAQFGARSQPPTLLLRSTYSSRNNKSTTPPPSPIPNPP